MLESLLQLPLFLIISTVVRTRTIGAQRVFNLRRHCHEHSDLGCIAIFLMAPVDSSREVASGMASASAANETSILDLPPVPSRTRKIRQMGPIGEIAVAHPLIGSSHSLPERGVTQDRPPFRQFSSRGWSGCHDHPGIASEVESWIKSPE
jgi:hypothetical protein